MDTLPATIVLASASPRRRQLLKEAGYRILVIPSSAEEEHDPAVEPEGLVMGNALLKAADVAVAHPAESVIGADTLVYLDGKPLGKPADLAEAREMLGRLSGRTHQVITGVAVIVRERGIEHCFAETTWVSFRPFDEALIDDYLASIDPLDKAGAYAAQDGGERIIASVDGSFRNVVGLPVLRLGNELRALGLGHHLPAQPH